MKKRLLNILYPICVVLNLIFIVLSVINLIYFNSTTIGISFLGYNLSGGGIDLFVHTISILLSIVSFVFFPGTKKK